MGGPMLPPCYLPGLKPRWRQWRQRWPPSKIPCMYCYTQCHQPCSRPPPTHASTGDSWTLTGKSGSDSCGVTAPLSSVLVHTRFCLCPPRVYFPVLCKFWQLYDGPNGDILQENLCHTHTQSPCPYSASKTVRWFYILLSSTTIFRAFSLNKIVCGCWCGWEREWKRGKR